MKIFLKIFLGSICCIFFVIGLIIRESPLDVAEQNNLLKNVQFQMGLLNAVPVELSIPRLGIYAPIEAVGILDNNAMAVPINIGDVGWYEHGPRPGDMGSSVLAGHVNWINGEDAVFTSLHFIEIGDTVQVNNSVGSTDTFIVRNVKDYPENSDASDVFSSSDGSSWLNLITCDGAWDAVLKTHRLRLVVFTEKL